MQDLPQSHVCRAIILSSLRHTSQFIDHESYGAVNVEESNFDFKIPRNSTLVVTGAQIVNYFCGMHLRGTLLFSDVG